MCVVLITFDNLDNQIEITFVLFVNSMTCIPLVNLAMSERLPEMILKLVLQTQFHHFNLTRNFMFRLYLNTQYFVLYPIF